MNHFKTTLLLLLVSVTVLVTYTKPVLPQQKEEPRVRFIAYDEPPMPVGGYAALQKNVVYPDSARKNGIEGTVFVSAYVDEKGKLSNVNIAIVSIMDGTDGSVFEGILYEVIINTGLDKAAIDAVMKTQFIPAKLGDEPVGLRINIPVEFRLPEE